MKELIQDIIKEFELTKRSGNKISRERKYLYPRQYFQWYLRQKGLTYEKIAEYIDCDHATVIHSCNNVRDMIDTDDEVFLRHTDDLYKYLQDSPIKIYTNDERAETSKEHIVQMINRLFQCRDMADVEALKKYVNDNIDPKKL